VVSDDVAIRVEGLGKQYFIGESSGGYRTLRDAVSDAASWATDRIRRRRPAG